MKPDIRNKLREKLAEGINDEANAVYLLVELRKLLEHESRSVRGQYSRLGFFCDWALHIEMDRAGAQRILKEMDARIAMFEGTQAMSQQVEKDFCDMFELVSFRKQFRTFLKRHRLPLAVASDDKSWFDFLELYARVVEDCPLVWKFRQVAIS